ncbi:GatB/YqeY domain-containing protein [soil metagenome]
MSLEARISQDLKAAMLAGQQQRVLTLRGIKSTVLYSKVANKNNRDEALPDSEVLALLARESKKRQESADLYVQGGSQDKADAELAEKAIIDDYLPAQLSEADIEELIEKVVNSMDATTTAQMGQVIGAVKQQAGAAADGAVIARLVKERLG